MPIVVPSRIPGAAEGGLGCWLPAVCGLEELACVNAVAPGAHAKVSGSRNGCDGGCGGPPPPPRIPPPPKPAEPPPPCDASRLLVWLRRGAQPDRPLVAGSATHAGAFAVDTVPGDAPHRRPVSGCGGSGGCTAPETALRDAGAPAEPPAARIILGDPSCEVLGGREPVGGGLRRVCGEPFGDVAAGVVGGGSVGGGSNSREGNRGEALCDRLTGADAGRLSSSFFVAIEAPKWARGDGKPFGCSVLLVADAAPSARLSSSFMNLGPAELAAGGGNDSWVGRGRGEARCVSAKPPPVRNVGVQCGALCSLYIFEGASHSASQFCFNRVCHDNACVRFKNHS